MSVLSHVFEQAGLTTVAVALVREHAAKVRPPRALYVPFPFGYTLGKPEDPEYQHRVIAATLDLLKHSSGPVLADFDADTSTNPLVQASAVQTTPSNDNGNPAHEVTALRVFYERWVADHHGRTAVGLSGVPQRRFRGTIRFLESYAQGTGADMKERPEDVSVPQFLRYCVDDLKAFYYEARMAQHPKASQPDLHTWFWGETATGQLISTVARRMSASNDAELKSWSTGLAR